jgi:hypothetical protein
MCMCSTHAHQHVCVYVCVCVSARTLINDLDLRVIGPDDMLHLGNDLETRSCLSLDSKSGDGCSFAPSLWRRTKSRDMYNNVESVRVASYKPGVYMIQVIGHDVPLAPQKFALVVTGGDYAVREQASCAHLSGCGKNDCNGRGTWCNNLASHPSASSETYLQTCLKLTSVLT